MENTVALGTLITPAKNVRCGDNKYPVLSMTMHNGLIFQDEKFKKVIASKDTSDYKVVYRNQLVISFPIDEGVLAAQRITDAGIVSPAYGIWDIDEAKVLPEFLEYALRCDRAIQYYKANLRGSTARRRSLPTPTLLLFTVPLPPLEEQEEILDRIHKAGSIIEKREMQLRAFDELIKARFVELFGDAVANPMNWPVKKLKDLSVQINSGNTPKGGSENYVEKGITFFRSQNVWKDRLEMDDIAYIDAETHASMKRSSLKHGDNLMTKTGRINTENSSLGRAALYDGEDDMANVNGHVYFIRLKDGVNNKFILRILVSPEYRDLIRSVCVGGIDKRQLNKEHIEDFPIICPPTEMVDDYVAFVKQVDKSKVVELTAT